MDKKSGRQEEMSFWEHLDALRGVMFRVIAVLFVSAVALFLFMPWIFNNIILAPCRSDFVVYGLLDRLAQALPALGLNDSMSDFRVDLINIRLASQFLIHMSASCWLALVVSFPVIIYLLWGFIKPGLYENERKGARMAFLFGNLMFYVGVCVGYFMVFPLTVRFLSDYQLSEMIPNQISIDSYMDTFITVVMMMGLFFELPLLAWLLGGMGLLHRNFFNTYRRHAIVALLILAAIITPTGDPFTLFVVFAPIYLLWEFSAFLVKKDVVSEEMM
jgi:Twin arginine targeting (Tat) protein translocase TatC